MSFIVCLHVRLICALNYYLLTYLLMAKTRVLEMELCAVVGYVKSVSLKSAGHPRKPLDTAGLPHYACAV